MRQHNAKALVAPFGLTNTGVICYMNALIQALLGCSSFIEVVTRNAAFLQKTKLGQTIHQIVEESKKENGRVSERAAQVVATLAKALKNDNERATYGRGQECAAEGLVHLLASLDAPPQGVNPIAHLFYHRTLTLIICEHCKKTVSANYDKGVVIHVYGETGSLESRLYEERAAVEGYRCPKCGGAEPKRSHRYLQMAPEILVVVNAALYKEERKPQRLPEHLRLPGVRRQWLHYTLVSQVDHTGTTKAGHYTATSKRADGEYVFNDGRYRKKPLGGSESTFMAFYHYSGRGDEEPLTRRK